MSDRGTPYDRIAGSSDWPPERPTSQIEWGLRNELGNVLLCSGEDAAREHAARYGEVVQIVTRTVTAWEPVASDQQGQS